MTGQVVIVTGGGRGLGRAFAQVLAAAGATVAVVARSEDQLADTVAGIEAAGGRAIAFVADVTDRPAVTRMVSVVEHQLGPVDVLVNNAGIATPLGPFSEVDAEEWWRCLEVNLRGPFLCSRAVLPGMLARSHGRIINVASGVGVMTIPFMSAYVVSKSALIRLTESLAAETKRQGVSVFAIEPGTVRTPMAEDLLESAAGRKWMPWFGKIFEEGRDVPADRAAQLVLRLASGGADALSGRLVTLSELPEIA